MSATLVPADQLSDREARTLTLAQMVGLTPGERLELLDFLEYPEPMPPAGTLRTQAVVLRILAARARGEHVA